MGLHTTGQVDLPVTFYKQVDILISENQALQMLIISCTRTIIYGLNNIMVQITQSCLSTAQASYFDTAYIHANHAHLYN